MIERLGEIHGSGESWIRSPAAVGDGRCDETPREKRWMSEWVSNGWQACCEEIKGEVWRRKKRWECGEEEEEDKRVVMVMMIRAYLLGS